MLQVDSDFLLILSAAFSSGWKIVTSFHIPGTNLNVAEFVFACYMVVFVIKIVPSILGFKAPFDPHSSDSASSISQNTKDGNSPNDIGRW